MSDDELQKIVGRNFGVINGYRALYQQGYADAINEFKNAILKNYLSVNGYIDMHKHDLGVLADMYKEGVYGSTADKRDN